MDAPDTSDIDLDPAHFRCPADLWYRLHQLHEKVKAKYPSYEALSKQTGVADSTLSDLLGENSRTRNNKNKPEWDTVRRFVRGCGVPESELERWRKAWEAAVAQGKPTWPEEQQQLLATIDQLTKDLTAAKTRANQLASAVAAAKAPTDRLTADLAAAETRIDQYTSAFAAAKTRIDQLTADLAAAEARAMDAETALAAYRHVPSLPAPIEQLRIRAQTYYDADDYTGAIKLYRQIATDTEREYGPGDLRTLQTQRKHLEVETEASQKKWKNSGLRELFLLLFAWYDIWFLLFVRRKLKARWRDLICEYQRYLSESDRATLELRLDHIYWVAILLTRDYGEELPPARKLLIALHADCKLFLPVDDPFTAQVAAYMSTVGSAMKRPVHQQRSVQSRPPQRKRSSVSDFFQYDGAEPGN